MEVWGVESLSLLPNTPPSALHKQHGGSRSLPSVSVNPGLVLLQERRRSEDYVNWKKKNGGGAEEGVGVS